MPGGGASKSAGRGGKQTAPSKRKRVADEEVSFKWKGGEFYDRDAAPWDVDEDEEDEEGDDSCYTECPDVTAKVSGSILLGAQEVGSVFATLYRRHYGSARGSMTLHCACDAESEDAQEMSCALFDGHGNVTCDSMLSSPAWHASGHARGFLHITSMHVAVEHHGKELELQALRDLLDRVLMGKWGIAVMEFPAENAKLARYFARVGFTQCGRVMPEANYFFVTSGARKDVPKSQADAIVPAVETKALELSAGDTRLVALVKHLSSVENPAAMQARAEARALLADGRARFASALPLHRCAVNDHQEALRVLLALGGDINATDNLGNTPLHVAAEAAMSGRGNLIPMIRLLLSLGADLTKETLRGWTPLKSALNSRADSRKFTEAFGGRGQEWGPGETLKHLSVIIEFMPAEDKAQCIDGWFTPRMHDRLLNAAEDGADICRDTLECRKWVNRQPQDGDDLAFDIFLFKHVPKQLRSGNVSFCYGFQQCLDAIAKLLEKKIPPTTSRVMAVLNGAHPEVGGNYDNRYTGHYFQNGGKVDFALNAILACSQEEHEVHGNGEFLALKEESASWPDWEALKPIPGLEDDYDMVRAKLIEPPPNAPFRFGFGF